MWMIDDPQTPRRVGSRRGVDPTTSASSDSATPDEAADAASRIALPPVEAVDALTPDAIPAFIAHAAALQARAAARLRAPAAERGVAAAFTQRANAQSVDCDRQLTVPDVAELLNAKPAWVYRHQRQLGGQKLDGLLRFSARRVQAYIERQHRMAV
jgi:hypothetical protein